jgi:hypothetical protein
VRLDVDSKERVVRSNCRGCVGGHGVAVYGEGNTLVGVEGDSDFHTNQRAERGRGKPGSLKALSV